MADYGKQKSGKSPRNRPPHSEHNAPGGPANPFGAQADKAALVARMKAAAERGKTTEPQADAAEPEVRPEGEG